MALLAARGLAVGYGRRTVLRDVDAALEAGTLTCVLGPNGTGKSTLLRTLAGMQAPLSGRVELDGRDLADVPAAERARRLSVVLTERLEVGGMSAYDLVALGRHPYTGWAGRLREVDRAAVTAALAAAGADDLAGRAVAELSDGERQRVLIARALAQEPAVLLLDEPTAFLDVSRRVEVGALLRDLARETGKAVLFSTHELELALASADAVWLLQEDATVRVGAPEDLVLDGSFARAFAAAGGLAFDAETGRFLPRGAAARRGRVTGEGLAATWAARALQRRGYDVVANGGPVDVEVVVVEAASGAEWRVGERRFTSLGALAGWLP